MYLDLEKKIDQGDRNIDLSTIIRNTQCTKRSERGRDEKERAVGEASGNGQMGPPGNGASEDNRTDGQEVKCGRNGSGDWATREVRKKNIEEDKLLRVGTCVLVFSSG